MLLLSLLSLLLTTASLLNVAHAQTIPAPIQARLATGSRLVHTSSDTPAEWMSEDQMYALLAQGHHFMDVTDEMILSLTQSSFQDLPPPASFAPPTAGFMQQQVTSLAANVSTASMREFLTKFSSFPTRFYQSPSGIESSEWLFQTLTAAAAAAPPQTRASIRVDKFLDPAMRQNSIIARIEGTNPAAPNVILGAHQDSVNMTNRMGNSPGADDDGSGTTSLFEAFRVLAASGFQGTRPIEFQFYAAEEAGLLGSQAIARAYRAANVQVAGMLQLDMTGYLPANATTPVISLVSDLTDATLSGFVRGLITTYTDAQGYFSDHASWTRNQYAAAFPVEAPTMESVTPFIHTMRDTVETVNFDHVARFAKVAIGFAMEMSMAP
ncbi:hypothetical protein HDV05_007932 [Chytridiales sp. JEL 0842]|nr:hypothetical protein HDV05_007932 [Chytridiales sp. JEL 0842]